MIPRVSMLALAAAAALLVAGCGEDPPPDADAADAGQSARTISLQFAGETQELEACGSRKPYVVVDGGAPLLARGWVVLAEDDLPRVKLKLKRCSDGVWQTSGEQHVDTNADGTFEAMVEPSGPGAYVVRAYHYRDTDSIESDKTYVQMGG